jgi:nitrogen fixation/metabolism regulation signal transduction histidine kinase
MICVSTEADLPNIQGDAEQLRQVIHNLLQNALDATQSPATVEGGPKQVLIRLTTNANQTTLQCSIEDNGVGFSEHILERAFEPYNTTKIKGTGLGLAVVRKIVQEHQGEITLSNKSVEEGLGARVSLLFPLTKRIVGV